MKFFWMALIAAVILFLIVMIVIDSNRFVIRKYVIDSDKVDKDHCFVFISDLHNKVYGKDNSGLYDAIAEIDPETVIIGGDLMTAYPGRDFSAAVDFVKNVGEKYPIVYALGNHEYRARIYPDVYGTLYDDYRKAVNEHGVDFLDNAGVKIADDVTVYGLTMDAIYYKRFTHHPMADDYVEQVLGKKDPDGFSILLAHDPDYFPAYSKWEPDLVLSGHIHGGVARIPGWKGVISPMWRLFPKYDGGRFDEFGSTMIISRGLGMHTIPLRLFNPAEIVVIDIKKE
ncbi:MAG: metallophosphoesterase [Lachnospiraceae bacterium]|nr:metallophosphoesterase [Lachnospiraceae bacterium]